MYIAQAIHYHRTENQLSLRQLGEKAGVSAMFLSDVEAGHRLPSAHVLEDIAAALGLPLTYFDPWDLRPVLTAVKDRMERDMVFFESMRELMRAKMRHEDWVEFTLSQRGRDLKYAEPSWLPSVRRRKAAEALISEFDAAVARIRANESYRDIERTLIDAIDDALTAESTHFDQVDAIRALHVESKIAESVGAVAAGLHSLSTSVSSFLREHGYVPLRKMVGGGNGAAVKARTRRVIRQGSKAVKRAKVG